MIKKYLGKVGMLGMAMLSLVIMSARTAKAAFSTSTLGATLEGGMTELTNQIPDVAFMFLQLFGALLGLSLLIVLLMKARMGILGAVAGRKKKKR